MGIQALVTTGLTTLQMNETDFQYSSLCCEIGALRLPDSYDAKIAKICNLWTFWPVIQSITTLFTSMEHWKKRVFVRF